MLMAAVEEREAELVEVDAVVASISRSPVKGAMFRMLDKDGKLRR